MTDIDRLLTIMQRLRDPEGGCPWDREQTFGSIVPHTLEEAYEVADAIEQEDWQALPEELGDLLFQVVFYAQLGKEEDSFDFGDIVAAASAKLVRRHPHVFGDEEVRDAADQSRRWEAHKAAERARSQVGDTSALDGVAGALPAVQRAGKLQGRAERAGFEWPRDEDLFAKVDEELDELRYEVTEGASQQRLEHEAGDLLFAAVGLARRLGVDPEVALRTSNCRFERRFRHMEKQLAEQGQGMEAAGLEDLKAYWQTAKRATDSDQE